MAVVAREAPADLGRNPIAARVVRCWAKSGEPLFEIRHCGTWFYQGTPINRKELVCLFASVLRRDPAGGYWLETPAERQCVVVADVPFMAVALHWSDKAGRQSLTFRTNVDQMVTADADHPIRIDQRSEGPVPYVVVRLARGGPAIEARISRAVFYELAALAVPEWVGGCRKIGVWSCGVFFPLFGTLPADV